MEKINKEFKLASWLIILGVIIYIPAIILYFVDNEILKTLALFLGITYTAIWVYVYTLFKKLLNNSYKYHGFDLIIYLSIGINVVSTLISTSAFLGIVSNAIEGVISLPILLIAGGISILFGIRLLNFKGNLLGKNKTLGYLSIIYGAFYVTLVLAPIGILFQLASDIVLATFFDKAAEELN